MRATAFGVRRGRARRTLRAVVSTGEERGRPQEGFEADFELLLKELAEDRGQAE